MSTSDNAGDFDFNTLVTVIRQVHDHCAAQAGKAVNLSLTLRNWLIGFYIQEYEQNGADRAAYGEHILLRLAERLQAYGISRAETRELRRYRQFYRTYPQIRETLTPELRNLFPNNMLPPTIEIRETLTPEYSMDGKTLLGKFSFSHLIELINIEDPLKRSFYEIECLRGNWSVRELKRQINSLYFERSGLSKDKAKLAELAQSEAERAKPKLAIRDPYIFEFLGLKAKEVMTESNLEEALLDKLQDFLLELGHGFCFEARQKRLLIGQTYYFIDLVFYHRVLKCHVLLELKLAGFSHEHLGQLNTYLNWYRKHVMAEGDNPPVGLLLCTQKDHALVEYALAGMDNQLFVSKYQLELPKKEELQRFLKAQMEELGYEA